MSKSSRKKIVSLDPIEELKQRFFTMLKFAYWCEKAVIKSFPKLHRHAQSAQLRFWISEHLAESKLHLRQLDMVFGLIGQKPVARKSEPMESIFRETSSLLKGSKPGFIRDAGIIGCLRKVEHHEIASYGGLTALARLSDLPQAAEILVKILEEEKRKEEILSELANADPDFG
jgi:ferritin-like metal-binding protein YciE